MRNIINISAFTFAFLISLSAQSTQPIPISSVTGLNNALNIRPSQGSQFSVSRTAVIDSMGQIDAAVGSLSDCVHVDGTSGPCSLQTAGLSGPFQVSGAMDGTNISFTLPANFSATGLVLVFRNGLLMEQALDYTLNVAVNPVQLTFAQAQAPQTGDLIQVYAFTSSAASQTNSLTSGTTRSSRIATAIVQRAVAAQLADPALPYMRSLRSADLTAASAEENNMHRAPPASASAGSTAVDSLRRRLSARGPCQKPAISLGGSCAAAEDGGLTGYYGDVGIDAGGRSSAVLRDLPSPPADDAALGGIAHLRHRLESAGSEVTGGAISKLKTLARKPRKNRDENTELLRVFQQ